MRRWNVTSKFEFRVAHKRYAPLERLNFIFGWFTKGMRRWNAPSSSKCDIGWLTKVTRPLEWHLPPLNFTLGRLTKGMLRWNVIVLL